MPSRGRAAQRGHWAWWAAPFGLALAWLLWSWSGELRAAVTPERSASRPGAAAAGASPVGATAPPASSSRDAGASAPFSDAGWQARAERQAMWQQRLVRARQALDAYAVSTRYPPGSRPVSEHPDHVHPDQPIQESIGLRGADGKPLPGLKLVTMQERVFLQGNERVRFTVAVRSDDDGALQPLRIQRASASELPRPGQPMNLAPVALDFTDDGAGADAVAADRVYSSVLQPATQGFATLAGGIRVQVWLEVRSQPGTTFFDIYYTPKPPATWVASASGIRESVDGGSLDFFLKLNVDEAGRYVVNGRIDDAQGKPFALVTFNDELPAGEQEVRLSVFGKLLRDGKPAFPLTLHDVDGFLLRPDVFPDRSLLARRSGMVTTSRIYPLSAFADAEWTSEERTRYLTELGKDVSIAQNALSGAAPPKGP